MEDTSGSVMIALLPINADWCKIELPHLTLVYVGETKDLSPGTFNDLAKDASMLATLSNPITLRVMGVELFGDVDQVDALRLQASPELLAMRQAVEKWNGSEYPFKPHCTIGPPGSFIDQPRWVAFNRILVGWGEETLTFSINTGSSSVY